MRYCPNCQKNIKPVKSAFSWFWFLMWWFIATIPYLIYHAFKPKNRCPICGLKGLTRRVKITA